jgi:hypothetical protein
MVKHDIPNRPFMIVQSIDKLLRRSSGFARSNLYMVFLWSETSESRFSTKDIIKNQSMIRFTITSGKLVLDPNIVLFKGRIYLIAWPKFLQVIYYTHSTEPDNPFTGLDRVLEENICGRCLTKALGRSSNLRQLKINSNWLQTFSWCTTVPEIRMLKSIDKK